MTAPEHAHSACEQANEQALRVTAPDQPAATINSELIVRLTDAIRKAAHDCPDQQIIPPGPVPPPACDCDDKRTVYASLEVEGALVDVCATPESLAEVCAAVVQPELDAKGARIAHLEERYAELHHLELGIKSLTTADGRIDMDLGMAHELMRVYVAAFMEVLDKEGGPNYVEMMFKLAGSTDRYTVTIRRPDGKTPGEVATEWRQRAEAAEERLRDQNGHHT